ncbi:DUF6057 family protein [uncultured Draconibacterium sp.]|uniref:DUF6057 family protein n=1 Tax=uncultured Draconibacterium sp. TaxID=1573823 RepID=UPI0032164B95
MNEVKNIRISQIINLLFFAALVVFWGFFYSAHLVQKEQMQLFLLSFGYLKEHLAYQGGFAVYLGEFFSQFFLFKWIAVVLTSFFIYQISYATQKVLAQLFKANLFLLAYVPAIVYHFLLLDKYYQLSGIIAVGLGIWTLSFYLMIKQPLRRYLGGLTLIIGSYWLLGGAYILLLLSIIIIEVILQFRNTIKKPGIQKVIAVVSVYLFVGILTPLLCRKFFLIDTMLRSYISAAYYQFSFLLPTPLLMVFLSLPILILVYVFKQKLISVKALKPVQVIFAFVLVIGFVWGSNKLADFNEETELNYENLVNQQKWEQIISLAEQKTPEGRKGKLALSLALAKTGQMANRLFAFSPSVNDFFIPFNIHGMAPLIANEPYFYLGLSNFSKMLCIETIESTPDEKSPVRVVKRFAENCIIDGQYAVAEKQLRYLKKTLFYSTWAKNAQNVIHNEVLFNEHPLWKKLRSQKVKDDFYFQFERNDLALVSLLRSNPQNKMAYEYLMCWYLLHKDFDEFLKYLPLTNTMEYAVLPQAFQEAIVYIKTLFPEVPEGLNEYKIDQEVNTNLNKYAEEFQQGGFNNPEEMKKRFEETYWYYVHFTKLEDE